MFSYQLQAPTDNCSEVCAALDLVNEKLDFLGKTLYNNTVHLSTKSLDKRKMKDLIYYKYILTHLLSNAYYYEGISYQDIISKVKTYTV
jgi:hypothetical protein